MTRGYRFAAQPKWLAGHLLVFAGFVTMVLLGRWQLDVSNSRHFNIQNFGYALQWWIFSLATLWGWSKILRDNASAPSQTAADTVAAQPAEQGVAHGRAEALSLQPAVIEQPVQYRRYLPPQAADRVGSAEDDDVLTSYNAYLASLDEDKKTR